MSREVKYSINGKYFKDFGVYVSESKGIADALERKEVQQYDWSEYHGISVDLSKPKYKERTIELKCFIDGDNWESLFEIFKNFIRKEFSKPGTQRLHIEPFDYKILPYEVYMQDEIELEKTFRTGRMAGVFTLTLIEPNPIKKVLYSSLDNFKLKYNSPTETEIFFGDGTKQIAYGNVSMTKNYEFPSYQGSGITLIQESSVNSNYYEAYVIPAEANDYQFSVDVTLVSSKNIILYVIGRKLDNTYEAVAISSIYEGVTGINNVSVISAVDFNSYGKFIFKVLDSNGNEVSEISYSNPRIEQAEIIGEWQNMIGKEKILIIAGNIEDLTYLETEAEILWENI